MYSFAKAVAPVVRSAVSIKHGYLSNVRLLYILNCLEFMCVVTMKQKTVASRWFSFFYVKSRLLVGLES